MSAGDTSNVIPSIYVIGDIHISRQIFEHYDPESASAFSGDRSVSEFEYLAGAVMTEQIIRSCQEFALGRFDQGTGDSLPVVPSTDLTKRGSELARKKRGGYRVDGPQSRILTEYEHYREALPVNTYLASKVQLNFSGRQHQRVLMTADLGMTPSKQSEAFEISHIEDAKIVVLDITFTSFLSDLTHVEELRKKVAKGATLIIKARDRSTNSSRDKHQVESVNENLTKLLTSEGNPKRMPGLGDQSWAIVSGDDLRAVGHFISEEISWERTIECVVQAAQKWKAHYSYLQHVRYVVVTFGYDGAVVLEQELDSPKVVKATLLYEPEGIEGHLIAKISGKGKMRGIDSNITAGLAHHLMLNHLMEEDRAKITDKEKFKEIWQHSDSNIAICGALTSVFDAGRKGVMLGLKASRVMLLNGYDELVIGREAADWKYDAREMRDKSLKALFDNLHSPTILKAPNVTMLEHQLDFGRSARLKLRSDIAFLSSVSVGSAGFNLKHPLVQWVLAKQTAGTKGDEQVAEYEEVASAVDEEANVRVPESVFTYPFDLVACIITSQNVDHFAWLDFEKKHPMTSEMKSEFRAFTNRIENQWVSSKWIWSHELSNVETYDQEKSVQPLIDLIRDADPTKHGHFKTRWSILRNLAGISEEPSKKELDQVGLVAYNTKLQNFFLELATYIATEGPGWLDDRKKSCIVIREKIVDPKAEESQFMSREEMNYHLLKFVPPAMVRVGDYLALDRYEGEDLRELLDVVREAFPLDGKIKTDKPVSVLVSGPPGAGKGFIVRQLKDEWKGSQRKFEYLPFNLSQFTAPDDLKEAFELVGDTYLNGSVPIVLWDEFDTTFGEDQELFWLSQFIGPMWDGEYLFKGKRRRLPPCIFVFAGSRFSCFREMDLLDQAQENEDAIHQDLLLSDSRKQALLDMKEPWSKQKGRDFKSRLVSKLDTVGVNPVQIDGIANMNSGEATEGEQEVIDQEVKTDGAPGVPIEAPIHFIKRAAIFRSYIQRNRKNLMTGKKINIEPAIMSAFLRIDTYRHGARSMEQILRASTLKDRTHFNSACLPSEDILNLHVDGRAFMKIIDDYGKPNDGE